MEAANSESCEELKKSEDKQSESEKESVVDSDGELQNETKAKTQEKEDLLLPNSDISDSPNNSVENVGTETQLEPVGDDKCLSDEVLDNLKTLDSTLLEFSKKECGESDSVAKDNVNENATSINVEHKEKLPEHGQPLSDEATAEQNVKTLKESKSIDQESRTKEKDARISEKEPRRKIPQASFSEEHVELDYDEDMDEPSAKASDSKDSKSLKDENRHERSIGFEDADDGELEEDIKDILSDKDDGEVDDDDDCEEGEIREPGNRKPFQKPLCRFYTKGHCTWGASCRFLHPGVNDKGNYRLIERPGFNNGFGPGMHNSRGMKANFKQAPWFSEVHLEPDIPPPREEPPTESAWERGLRHAKELMKKANQRKEQEINFEEKRLNLGLEEEREQNKENEQKRLVKETHEIEEEDDYYKSPVHGWQVGGQYENFEVRWTREPEPQHIAPVTYRLPVERERERERERPRERQYTPPVERPVTQRYEKRRDPSRGRWREERTEEVSVSRTRADEWRDPWRRDRKNIRSKSPKQKHQGSSSRSWSRGRRRTRRSYSVSSSYSSRSSSYSSYSSRSSYSRSSSYSSRSSVSRSRSPSPQPSKKMGSQKTITAPAVSLEKKPAPAALKSNDIPKSAVTVKSKPHVSPEKKKIAGLQPAAVMVVPKSVLKAAVPPLQTDRGRKKERTPPRIARRSWSHGSSGSSLAPSPTQSHSRSQSRSHSKSHSCSRSSSSSFSRSPSASSISSLSSSASSSSSGSADSEHLYRDIASPASTRSTKSPSPHKAKGEKGKSKSSRSKTAGSQQSSKPPSAKISKPSTKQQETQGSSGAAEMARKPLNTTSSTSVALPKTKDPLKLAGQKSNIKLTLISKPTDKEQLQSRKRPADSAAVVSATKRSATGAFVVMKPAPEKSGKPAAKTELMPSPSPRSKPQASLPPPAVPPKAPTKIALSPLKPPVRSIMTAAAAATQSAKSKKSTSSRREELLKQLKAVEDAIARKRAKMQ